MMRLRSELLLPLLAVGCNWAFGLEPTRLIDAKPPVDEGPDFHDRDRDGITDSEDPCIQSVWDREGDWDGDSYLNKNDGCPFDYESTDTDGDGAWDECDPFPMIAGDRTRCIMGFRNPTLDAELWHARDGSDKAWNMLSAITGNGAGSIVADESFEAPSVTSYDLVSYSSNPVAGASDGTVTLFVRAALTASPSDSGCRVTGTASSAELSIVGDAGATPVTIAQPLVKLAKIDATIEPGQATNIRCRATFLGSTGYTVASTKGHIELVPGHVGFAVRNTSTVFSALDVYERDDAPPL